ncbi:MAG: hypothetical protein HY286_06370 [Planctomycetes bacterium]|nr:hypothetical protein [Planctomycetota bacterium]
MSIGPGYNVIATVVDSAGARVTTDGAEIHYDSALSQGLRIVGGLENEVPMRTIAAAGGPVILRRMLWQKAGGGSFTLSVAFNLGDYNYDLKGAAVSASGNIHISADPADATAPLEVQLI